MKEVIVRLTSDHIKVKGGEYVQDLVRCKECKYYTKRKFTDGSGEIWEEEVCDHHNLTAPTSDDFCSYGERRES